MNVFFNNKEIMVTAFDTENSIKSKIAIELKTLPKYLHFPTGFPKPLNNNQRYIVEDLLETIKKFVSIETSEASNINFFLSFYNNIIPKFSMKINTISDIITPFIIYNVNYIRNMNEFIENGTIDFIDAIIEPLSRDLNVLGISFSKDELLEKLKEYKKNIKKFEKSIKDNLTKDIENNESSNILSTLNGVKHTDFKMDENIIELKLNIPSNFSVLDIFNFIELNNHVQFASCNGFYKIFGDFIAPEHWIINNNNEEITLYILKTKMIKRKNKEESSSEEEP